MPVLSASVAELDDQTWTALSVRLDRFEEAWKAGTRPELAAFVPATDDPLRIPVLIELIKVDQEFRWRAGERRLVETYLRDWPDLGDSQTVLLDLVRAECLTRAVFDVLPPRDELAARFPHVSEQIDLTAIEAEAREERPSGDCNHSELAPDSRFGHYEIRALMGRGAMGNVYRARDTRLDREVALKIPRLEHAAEPFFLERFVREAHAAAAIQHHGHVCPVYEAGEIEGTHYITMPLVEGQSLEEWLDGRTVAPREAAHLVHKLALALVKVHAVGIVHRDIKSANVLIDDAGEPILLDFGLARPPQEDQESLPTTGLLSGTPAYMAPELLSGASVTVDGRSDIYSLGVLLYQVLTGRLPFTGRSPEVLTKIPGAELPSPRSVHPGVDPSLETICLKAMAERPENRYQSAAELAAALEEYLRSTERSAAGAYSRSRLVWLIVAAVVVLISVATAAYFITGANDSENREPADRLREVQFARKLELGPSSGVNLPGEITLAGEHHWYQVQAVRTASLKVCLGTIGSQLNPSVTVYDADLQPIKSAQNVAGHNAEFIIAAQANQVYSIEVSGVGTSTGRYALLVSQPKLPRQDFPPLDDHPSARYAARVVTFDAQGEMVVRGVIAPVGDEDWFTFTAPRSGELLITVETPESSLDPHLELYDADKMLVQHHDRIRHAVTAAGQRYWLKVRAGSEKGADDIGPGELPTGRYLLRIRLEEGKK